MLINLFNTVKSSGVPCSLRELLDLIGALEARITYSDMNDFYYLSRAILVKDEKHYDKFDRAFEIYFKGCLLYTSPSPRDRSLSRMPSSA